MWRHRAAVLVMLVALAWPDASTAAAFDQHPDFNSRVSKGGSLQGLQGVQQPATLMLDKSSVDFEPKSLQLKSQHTCVPRWEHIEIINLGKSDLSIESVYSSSNVFHPSLVKPETLQTDEAAKLKILFLAQVPGHFEGQVFLQTNLGLIPYTVKATAVDNPYKVEPIVGAKVVVGERFTPPIAIYNPHITNLHVREVFTTEGFLHLALPDQLGEGGAGTVRRDKASTREADASAGVWTVLPKQQKTVIHVSFVSQVTGKFQGYVHLKTDMDNLRVPVEVMVTKGGVHIMPEVVDFQTLVSPQQSRSMWLTLQNLNPQPIELLSLYDPKQDPNLQITGFDQKGVNVVPGATVRFARVTYHGGEEGFMHGKLQLIINDTDSVSATLDIPYKARVLYGSLGFMNDKTKFQSTPGRVTSTMRSIMISNNFSVPILIHNAKIDDPSFQITHFTPNTLLAPGDAVSLMHVEFTSNGTSGLYTRDLELSTNVTAMKIPLQVYHGRLHCQVEHGDLKECSVADLDLDMGTISVTESRRKQINITNLNPVNVTIESITFTHATVNLYMEGVWGPKGERVKGPKPVPQNLQSKRILTLPPNHRLALDVEVVATDAGTTSASVTISTWRKESIALQVRYESILGNLAFLPAAIRFEASFPGRVQSRIVAARSTFERPLSIWAVRSTDPRIIPELMTKSLSPLARTEIARIHYDPSKSSSPDESYLPHSDEVEWDVPLTEEIVERWAKRQKMWDELGAKGQTYIEATLLFDTNIVRGASLTVRAFLTKPCIVRDSMLTFDLTQVGTSVTQMLVIHNPSDTLLAVQLVFPLCDLIREVNSTCDVGFKLAQDAQQVFHVEPHSDLPVGPIVFEPQQHTVYNTTLYVRNNLTVLYPVQLNGIGGSGRLVFPNGTLDFNLTASDLGEDMLDDERGPRNWLAISKSFVATNDCELPVEVMHIDINGIPGCAGFGFEIHDCHPFTVAPHESVPFLVSFTPDFAASRWEQRLRLHTQSGILTVPLRAFVPSELLPSLADRAPFLGDSEASVKKVITIISVVLCAMMFVVVISDCRKIHSMTITNGSAACRDAALRHADVISLMSWAGVNVLAPPSLWSSTVRRDQLLGTARTARRHPQVPQHMHGHAHTCTHTCEDPHEVGHTQRLEITAPNDKRGCRAPAGMPPDRAAHTARVADPRLDKVDAQMVSQPYCELSKSGLPGLPLTDRAVEEASRRMAAEAAKAAVEEIEKRRREEERRKAREAEDIEKQVKAVAEEIRKSAEERKRLAAVIQQGLPPPPKADMSKGKKRGEKKEVPSTPVQQREAQGEDREGRRREVPTPAEARPRPREDREKPTREDRERAAREERDKAAREREEQERHVREERERVAREQLEKRMRDERKRASQEERERQRDRHVRDERERPSRDERERTTREERERQMRDERSAREDREAATQEERERQSRDERERQQRDAREKRSSATNSEQHANDKRGTQAEPVSVPVVKRKEPGVKRKEGPPTAPAKGPSAAVRCKDGQAQRPPAPVTGAVPVSGPGPLQGSVWADPKPSFLPQSLWIAGNGTAQKSPGASPDSPDGSTSPATAKISLPPPPAMPPPPAPKAKGGQPKPDASQAVAKQNSNKQGSSERRQQHPTAAFASATTQAAENLRNTCDPVPPRRGSHSLITSAPSAMHGITAAGIPSAILNVADAGIPTPAQAMPGAMESVLGAMQGIPGAIPGIPGPLQGIHGAMQGFLGDSAEQIMRTASFDRSNIPAVAPIGPAGAKTLQRTAASLLPDQEFIPINRDSPSLDRMQALFSSPFAMFGPVTSYGGDLSAGTTGGGLMADLHADSQPVENASGRHKPEAGNQLT